MLAFIYYELNFLINLHTKPSNWVRRVWMFREKNRNVPAGVSRGHKTQKTKLPGEEFLFSFRHTDRDDCTIFSLTRSFVSGVCPFDTTAESLPEKGENRAENLWKLAAWRALKKSEQESDYYRWKVGINESVFSCFSHHHHRIGFASIEGIAKNERRGTPEERRNYHLLRFY